MFFTMPLRTWPGAISPSNFFFMSSRWSSISLRPADDDVAAGLVDLEDLALDGLADVVGDVRRPADVHLAGRQEHVHADVHEQAALDLARDRAADDIAFLVLLDDEFPLFLPLRLLVAEDDGAAFILDGIEQDLNFLPRLGGHDLVEPLVVPFLQLDETFALVADVDDDVVANVVDNASLFDLVDLESLRLRSGANLRFPRPLVSCWNAASSSRLQVCCRKIKLTDEVTIHHETRVPECPDAPYRNLLMGKKKRSRPG